MLLQRVITALILAPLVLACIFYLPSDLLAIPFAIVILLAGWEWVPMAGLKGLLSRMLYLLSLIVGMAILWWIIQKPQWLILFFGVITGWWVAVSIGIVKYRPEIGRRWGVRIKLFFGWVVLVPLWGALIALHSRPEMGPQMVIFLMFLIWIADSGAYFAGRRWGHNKLAPLISPGKSWEGVYGALAGAALCGVFLYWWLPETGSLAWITVFCLAVCLFSVVGDLFESLLKRQAGIKDSSHILPGHGGMLDRIDSLTAAAPVFLFGLLLLKG
ncbi:MAG: phosphatidate cytidylyltransferase [Gammaproteobacteria bacterium]|nr:phosphatidate cytidylyltransferase [Gammaproteobacteria bacterium]